MPRAVASCILERCCYVQCSSSAADAQECLHRGSGVSGVPAGGLSCGWGVHRAAACCGQHNSRIFAALNESLQAGIPWILNKNDIISWYEPRGKAKGIQSALVCVVVPYGIQACLTL